MFEHTYEVSRCPQCNADFRQTDSVHIEFGCGRGRNGMAPSYLDGFENRLVDINGIVTHGHHVDTCCAFCNLSLCNYESR